MEIYTSYFANVKKLYAVGVTPISIAIGSPRWWKGAEYKPLAPTWHMVKDNIGRERYIEEYKQILSELDPCAVLLQLNSLAKDNDFALLCWEKPSDFCHRHIAAEWLMDNTGCIIKEFGVADTKTPKPQIKSKRELSLF